MSESVNQGCGYEDEKPVKNQKEYNDDNDFAGLGRNRLSHSFAPQEKKFFKLDQQLVHNLPPVGDDAEEKGDSYNSINDGDGFTE